MKSATQEQLCSLVVTIGTTIYMYNPLVIQQYSMRKVAPRVCIPNKVCPYVYIFLYAFHIAMD